MTFSPRAALLALPAIAALTSIPLAAAEAGGTVTACSRYGNGCYTAPVRPGKWGPEMRLKGGTWIECRGSCKDALREETVDFFETLREKSSNGRK